MTADCNKLQNTLEQLKISYTPNDILKIKENIDLLKQSSLSKLNARLVKSTKIPNFLDTLAEHNFISSTIKNCPHKCIQVEYELENTNPPDFKIRLNGITYLVEVKKVHRLAPINKQLKEFGCYFCNTTGIGQTQVSDTLRNASKKFNLNYSDEIINVIVIETGNPYDVRDINIMEALYGSEYEWENTNGKKAWCREKNGLFDTDKEFSEKVHGILVRKRKKAELTADYHQVFCINKFEKNIGKIESLLTFDKQVNYEDRPHQSTFFDL